MRISQALESYLLQLQADGRSPHTVGQARRHVRMLASFLGDLDIGAVRHEEVARFLASDAVRLRADGGPRKATSGNAVRSSLRAFFAYVHGAGYAPVNAARLVRRAMTRPHRPKPLTDEECGRLQHALSSAQTQAERRDRALFLTMLRTGLRLGSALGLDAGDVDLRSGEISVRRLKGGGEDVVFAPSDLCDLLRDFVGGRTSGPLFRGVGGRRLGPRQAHRRLAMVARAAEIEGSIHPHRLRHTFGTRAYQKTGDLLLCARAMCHRSLTSTALYAEPSRERIRALVEA